MHLPETAYNLTISTIWTSFSEDKRTDNLPMMGSIAWPIGGQFKIFYFKVLIWNFISAIGILDIIVALSTKSWWCKWWYPHMLSSTTKCDQIWNCLVLIFSLTQGIVCIMTICLAFHSLLVSTGMYGMMKYRKCHTLTLISYRKWQL